jgi:LmbE family N-acetylglucosaminyl deacetylase
MADNQSPTQNSKPRTQYYQHVYFSPHFDDVPLSCGGQVAAQTRADEGVLVVTVCSQTPPASLKRTPFAADMEQQWQESSGDTVADTYVVRHAEEQRALTRLGADHQWLDYLDAIYRLPQYDSDFTLFGTLEAGDLHATLPQLEADIARVATTNPQATLYFPLAVGNHVDHQLVYMVGLGMVAQGRNVLFYEDFPYVGKAGVLERRIRKLPLELQPQLTDIRATLDDKIAAIAEYTSQMGILFDGETKMREQVHRFATLVAQGAGEGLAERYWLPAA